MAKIVIEKMRKMMPALLPPGAISETAKVMKCSRSTVWDALRNNRKGPVSDRIRAYVLEKYGREVAEKEVNND